MTKLKSGNSLEKKKRNFVVVMLAIPCIHWLVCWLYINMTSILYAFQLPTGEWSMSNFASVFDSITMQGGDLNIALRNTLLYFSTSVLIVIPLSLLIAFFIYKRIEGYRFYRVVFYLPAIISAVAFVGVYKELIQPWGPVVSLLEKLGVSTPEKGYLGDYHTATYAIVVYCIWTGFASNMLLFSGAMTRIPIEIIESVKIEGCGPWKEFISIILPLIKPTISTMLIFTMTGIFSSSGPILLFTNGQFETTTISFWIFNCVYSGGGGQYNLVSCAGLCFTLLGVPIILIAKKLLDDKEDVEY